MKLDLDISKLRAQLEETDTRLLALHREREDLERLREQLAKVMTVADPSWFKKHRMPTREDRLRELGFKNERPRYGCADALGLEEKR